MSSSLHKRLKDLDFTNAKPVKAVPALVKLQAGVGKARITIRIDQPVLDAFKAQADVSGASYQTLINEALRQHLQGQDLVRAVKETIRRELRAH
jgi:uncharacterized protein (DUF4415 family)